MTDRIFPAEWERHACTWMAWPCRREAWGSADALSRAKVATATVARAIAGFEPVVMAARPQDAGEATAAGVPVFSVPLDDSWTRDIAPTFVRRQGERLAVCWRFNGWGEKYAPHGDDAAFGARLAAEAAFAAEAAPLVCEGGALHSDGAGTLLTTAQCLLNPNRNSDLSRSDVEALLRIHTGAARIVWLDGVFSDTETDGHVDNIACFAAPGRVILGIPAQKNHPDHEPVMAARQKLRDEGFEVIELAQPMLQRQRHDGSLLPASYVNFYLCNGGLVMPSFDDANDEAARRLLADCFPGRTIVQVPALDLVAGGGGIHCITAQEPR